MKHLVVVAVVIITGLLTNLKTPQHINNQVAPQVGANPISEASSKNQVKATSIDKPVQKIEPQIVQDKTVTPVITSSTPNCDKYDALLIENFGTEQLNTAKAIMRAESGCRADAVGDSHITFYHNGQHMGMSCGLFQIRILPGRDSCETYKNPTQAINKAGSMYRASGWKPWSAFKNGSYRKFLR